MCVAGSYEPGRVCSVHHSQVILSGFSSDVFAWANHALDISGRNSPVAAHKRQGSPHIFDFKASTPSPPRCPVLCSPSAVMDKLSNITKFKSVCPYLGRTKSSTIRTLYTAASPRYPTLSKLTEKATQCPVMGNALTVRSNQMVAGYASLAGSAEFNKIPEHHGVRPSAADAAKCPHASKAITAARVAEDLASAKKGKAPKLPAAKVAIVAPAGCPFHTADTTSTPSEVKPKAATPGGFNYEGFYVNELEKKRQDASYRYFNNINRKANKFPIAHTGDPKDEVEVWCANDYLGMGNNPVVLETMQCVFLSSASHV